MGTTTEKLQKQTPQQRADAILGLLSGGGLLPADKAREFIRLAQNATPLLQAARVVRMTSPTFALPKILFAGRVTKAAATDGSAPSSGDRSAPTTSEVTLVAKDYEAQVKIGYKFLRDNIEDDEVENTIMSTLIERIGVDLEEIGLAGDTGSGDAALALQDGWVKRISTNVVNAGSAAVSRALFEQLHGSVALKFRQSGKHVFFVQEHAGEKWRAIIGDRATALGDKAILEGMIPPAAGRPVIQVGNMPVASGPPATAPILFTDPKNLILGIWQDIDVRTFDDSREGAVTITARYSVAFNIEHEAAAAKATNVLATV